MANETRKIAWDTPAKDSGSEKQEQREHHYGLRSNLLTLLFSAIIILGGFLLPTLLYPYLDMYQGETVQLEPPSDSALAKRVFEDPVTIYPWDIYDELRLQELTLSEAELLSSKGIPEFLLATLRDHGWQTEENYYSYRENIVRSFQYLDPITGEDPGCFVLVNADIDTNGQADLTCAVDQQGNIISLLFLGDGLDSMQIDAPIGQPIAEPLTDDPEGDPAATEENNNPADNDDALPAQNTSDQSNPETTDPEAEPGGVGPNQEVFDHLPIDEEQNLWEFSYAISREAYVINQLALYNAFRQLELNYENRYGFAYTDLFPVQSEEPEELPEVNYSALTALPFATSDSLLYIYNLSEEERLILYLDPSTLHCKGFNLQRY